MSTVASCGAQAGRASSSLVASRASRGAAPFGRASQRQAVRVQGRYKIVDSPLTLDSSLLGTAAPAVTVPDTPAPQDSSTPSAISAASLDPAPQPPAITAPTPEPAPVLAVEATPAPTPAPEPISLDVSEARMEAATQIPDISPPSPPTPDNLPDLGASITESASNIASELQTSMSGLTGSVTDLSSQLTDTVGDGVSVVAESTQQAVAVASSAVGEAVSSVSSSVEGVASSVDAALSSLTTGAAQQLGGVTGQVGEVASSVSSTVSSLSAEAAQQLDEVTTRVSSAVGATTAQAQASLQAATSQAASLVQGVEGSLAAQAASAWAAIPEPAQGLLLQARDVAGAATSLALEYPAVTLGLAGAVTVPLLISSYQERFAGYAGELQPAEVAEMLAAEDEEVLLLDVRPEVEREKAGLLELKLRARFKAVALPVGLAEAQVAAMDPGIVKQVLDRKQLVLAVHATLVGGLRQVCTPLTKVVVMDAEGSPATRAIARALRTEGLYNAYIMQGGFAAWQAAELPVTTARGVEYDATAVDLLKDNIEVVQQQATALVLRLRDPAVALPVAATTLAGATALYYYETTLQVIGLAGISWSVYKELSQYDSPLAALSAWGAALSKLRPAAPVATEDSVSPSAADAESSSRAAPAPVDEEDEAAPSTSDSPSELPNGMPAPKLPPPPGTDRAEEVLARAAAAQKAAALGTTMQTRKEAAVANGKADSLAVTKEVA